MRSYYRYNEAQQYQNEKDYKQTIDKYNEGVDKCNKLFEKIKQLHDSLIKQEKNLQKCCILNEKFDKVGKTIMLIGPTGNGKSLLANRLWKY